MNGNAAARTELLAVIAALLNPVGTGVVQRTPSIDSTSWISYRTTESEGLIYDFDASGRLYGDGSNVRSYRVIMAADDYGTPVVREFRDSGECIVNNDCYSTDTPPAASDAEMGVLALINGMLDGAGGTANYARRCPWGNVGCVYQPCRWCKVQQGCGFGLSRPRASMCGRDISSGNLKADADRNIVIIQNNLAASSETGDVGSDATAVITASTGVYKAMFDALKVGLVADTNTQDIYVFAARDGNKDDVGLLAGLPIATGSGFAKYSIIAVAVESGTTQCGANTAIQAICIAAPGAYKYRVRANDGTYTSTTLADGATANAAASLVAGGLALLQSIFTAESTEDLVARLLLTSSQNYDLDGTPGNDFSATKHGQGLMDLDCAVRPMISTVSARTRTGCEDRFAPDQRAICLGMMQGYDSSNPNDCVTSSITAAQCVAAGGVKNGSDDECIARSACATVFNAGEDTCLAMCASGEGATSARVCGATADNDNCLNAMRAFDVENSTCRDDPACASDEFLGGSGFGANSCYTVAECVANDGGLSGAGTGTCIAATSETCYNAGSSTYFLEGGECVTSCDSGTPLMRSVSSMNSCVAAMACRDTHMGAVIGSDCLAASGTNCNMDMGRAFNSAMTACVASCIADDSGRGRNASHECVAASASSCRIAGGSPSDMGFFSTDTGGCVQAATDCETENVIEFAQSSSTNGNECVALCTDETHGIDPSENLCKATTDHNECREAARVLQGGACAAACSGATPIITAADVAECVAASGCVALGRGVDVSDTVYGRAQTVASRICGGANAGSCFRAGNSTYFFQGSSCVDACTDVNTPLKRSLNSMNQCVSATTCRTGGAGAVSGTADCVAASAQACLRDEGRGFVGGVCVTPTAQSACDDANATFNSTDMVCEISCEAGEGQNTIGACVALSDSSLSDTAAKIAACEVIGRLYDNSGTERCAENGADCGSDGIQGRAEVMVNSTGSAAQCITVAECAGAAYGVSSDVCVDATAATCRGAGADTYFYDPDGRGTGMDGCVSQCNINTGGSREVTRALASGNDCVTPATCRNNVHTGSVHGIAVLKNCVVASAESCAAESIGVMFRTFNGTTRCVDINTLRAGRCPATINGMAVEYDGSQLGCVFAPDRVAVGSGKSGEAVIDTRAKALALFTGNKTESGATDLVKNIRSEYQNQPSLGLVGAAQAYVSGVAETGADVESLAELRMGNHVTVSVITNKRFDPTHSEFDSAKTGAPYETLTRFRINNANGANFGSILDSVSSGHGSLYARQYTDDDSGNLRDTYYFLAPIGSLDVDGTPTPFDMIPRSSLDDGGADDPQAIALNRYLSSARILSDFKITTVGKREVILVGSDVRIRLDNGEDDAYIEITADTRTTNKQQNVQNVGRLYHGFRNIRSYEIALNLDNSVRDDSDTGECVSVERSQMDGRGDGTLCYAANVPLQANAAEMGLLALITGLLDGTGGDANTHGIAPRASLRVITAPPSIASGGGNIVQAARRAVDKNDLAPDSNGGIVVIQNVISNPGLTGNLIDEISTGSLASGETATAFTPYKALHDILINPSRDTIYVFASKDKDTFASDDHTDVGVLAGIPVVSSGENRTRLQNRSIIVVAAENGGNGEVACGAGSALLTAMCISAPGSYVYRTKGADNTYGTSDDGTATAVSANAAASLVAGGLAIIRGIFGTQLDSEALRDRILATASQCFNVNGATGDPWDGSSCDNSKNDYVGDKATPTAGDLQTTRYGQGLLDVECASRPSTTQARCRTAGSDAASCLASMQAFDGFGCVACTGTQGLGMDSMCTDSPAVGDCERRGFVLDDTTTNCITTGACTGVRAGIMRSFISSTSRTCVAMCAANQGVDTTGNCTATATADNCGNAMRFLKGGNCVGACASAEFINVGNNTCVSMCATGEGLSASSGTGRMCIASATATAMQCANAGLVLLSATGGCVSSGNCPAGQGVQGNTCTAYGSLTDKDAGCGLAGGRVSNAGTMMCDPGALDANAIIEAFRGTGNTAETSDLASVSGITDSSSTADKRRLEYANQPGLDIVGAAFAYAKAGDGAEGIDAAIAEAGKDSNISVIMNRRFHWAHPEFSSSAGNAKFETLTRFTLVGGSEGPDDLADVITSFFNTDEGKARVQVYSSDFAANSSDEDIVITIQVKDINSGVFEDISRTAFAASSAIRTELETFLKTIVGGASTTIHDTTNGQHIISSMSQWVFAFDEDGDYKLLLTAGNDAVPYQHVGRAYTDGGNVGFYMVVTDAFSGNRNNDDSGDCVNRACYITLGSAANIKIASGAEMGLLALINGLANPDADDVAANTHGIAPGATLSVLATTRFSGTSSNSADAAYKARGINPGLDFSGGAVTADDTRNIVLTYNSLINDHTGEVGSGEIGGMTALLRAFAVGAADSVTQDAFIFAARDKDGSFRAAQNDNSGSNNFEGTTSAATDVGVLASQIVTNAASRNAIGDFTIIAVAAEEGTTPCGSNTFVRAVCIAAPGEYKYRARNNDGTYATTLTDGASAHAAASLVAGGLALLESIFPTETTARLIDRLLMTASKKFNLDDSAGVNQYTIDKHGQGLMDLACAIRPILTDGDLVRDNCVDRYPDVTQPMSAPQQKPEDDPIPTGSAQGDKVEDDTAKSGIDYCDIDGLRIILSGDLCSDDHILLVDKDGKVQDIDIGNLRFGMGFGDSLLKGLGITFFDAFDTAWTVDNPYNPYAHLLNFGNIVIAPAQSRFDVEDRFSAMRYGTRPGQRKTWAADTARITMDFATQGMATKPYAVTRGQIRNTLTHDNMGADPYADVRFMLSAEDNIGAGLGRLKVMTYSGMAMGYALGLHAQGDAMMPSYLLTNRDSFHAPYLSLASSGLGGGMTYRFRDGGHIGFVMGEGTSLNADGTLPYQQQTERPRAFAGMMEYAPHQNLMFHMGALQEENTLLASQGSGLFDIEGGATAFVGVQAKQRLANNWQALFSGYGGRTQLGGSSGIVSGLDVFTSSFDLGLLGSHIVEKGDHLLLRAGQPMRVESGSLDLSYVSFRRQDRSAVNNVQSFDVAPSMRSVEFGVGYGLPLGQNGRSGHMRFAIDYVLNPGHRRVRDEVFGIMSFRREF